MMNEELLQQLITEIGDQYDDYEFLVYQDFPYEIMENNFSYDRYLATGKLKMKLNIPNVTKVVLYFNADVLSRIEILPIV